METNKLTYEELEAERDALKAENERLRDALTQAEAGHDATISDYLDLCMFGMPDGESQARYPERKAARKRLFAAYGDVWRTQQGSEYIDIPFSYIEFLENRVLEATREIKRRECVVAEYVEAHWNERLYREEAGFGDAEISKMQNRTREALAKLLQDNGWSLDVDADGFYAVKNLADGRQVNYGKVRWITKEIGAPHLQNL